MADEAVSNKDIEAVSMQGHMLLGDATVPMVAAEEEDLSGGRDVVGGRKEGEGECESVSGGYESRGGVGMLRSLSMNSSWPGFVRGEAMSCDIGPGCVAGVRVW